MTVVVVSDCPPKLRGDLTKWLIEVNIGVYVGNINVRIRESLWERICDNLKNGRATIIFPAENEQRMDFWVHNTTWEPVDYDGLKLMRRPAPHYYGTQQPILKNGFSKAAVRQNAAYPFFI